MAEPWVSVEQFATHLACAVDNIYRWLSRRGLPGYRVDSVWRFKIGEVDAGVGADGPNAHPGKAAG